MVRKINTECAVRREASLQTLQPFSITLKGASWRSGAASKKIINYKFESRSAVTRYKHRCILAIDFDPALVDPKVIRGHFDMDGVLLDCGEPRIREQRLHLQHRRAGAKAQYKDTSGFGPRMKIKPQPEKVPDTSGDHPTRIELAVQDAICVKPQTRAGTADFIAFALTPLRPEQRYDEAPGMMRSNPPVRNSLGLSSHIVMFL